jgi:hypothetical protein
MRKIKEFGFNSELVSGLIYSRYEAQIDTGEMMKTLSNMRNSLGYRSSTALM